MTLKIAQIFANNGLPALAYIDGKAAQVMASYCFVSQEENAVVMAEVMKEVNATKKKLIKQDLMNLPDTSADAIAEFHGVKKELARALCKGLGRNTKKSHYGNDYETRGKY